MSFDPANFNFSKVHLKMNGTDFKAFLKERYGKKYKAKELKEVHEFYYAKLDTLDD